LCIAWVQGTEAQESEADGE